MHVPAFNKGIWDMASQTHAKIHDAVQIYKIKTKMSITKQVSTITECSNTIIINTIK